MEIAQMQNLDSLARGFLLWRQRIRFRLSEPACEVQGCRRRQRAQRQEILTEQLSVVASDVGIGEDLSDYRA